MVNPGSFQGTRKEFLLSQKAYYEEAVQGGFAKDAIAVIQRRYFKRYPIDLDHNEEPTAEHLASVNDDAPDPDSVEPNPDTMDEAEFLAAMEAHAARAKLIVFRKGQIKRRLAYQYMKDHDLDPKESGVENPYYVLLCRLTNTQIQRPRAQSAMNLYRRSERKKIEEEVHSRAEATNASRSRGLVGLRSKVTKEWFDLLGKEEKDDWTKLAKEDHDQALAVWEAERKRGISTSPQSRQRCIESLSRFVQPILDGICEATGWKATLIAGGPEPAQGGIMSILSIHSGTISGDVKMNFGRSEHARYSKHVTPVFSEFLKKCYSVEECKSRALSGEDATGGLATMGDEIADINLEVIEFPQLSTQVPLHRPTPPSNGSLPSVSEAAVLPAQTQGCASNSRHLSTSPTGHPSLDNRTMPASSPHPVPIQSQPSDLTACNKEPILQSTPPSTLPSPSMPSQLRQSPRPSPPPSPGFSPPVSPRMSPSGVSMHLLQSAPHSTTPHNAVPETAANSPPFQRPSSPLPQLTQKGGRIPLGPVSVNEVHIDPINNNSKAPSSNKKRGRDGQDNNEASQADSTSAKKRRVDKGKVDVRGGTGGKNVRGGRTKGRRGNKVAATESIGQVDAPGPAHPVSTPKWFSTWSVAFVDKSKGIGKNENQWLGLEWIQLVEEWVAFEQENRFTEVARLPAANRPEIVHLWIKNARSVDFTPKIADVKAVQQQFDLWWDGLQPIWRKDPKGDVVRRRVDGDWSSLRLPGLNGLFSVVAALFYIGLSAHTVGRTRFPWVFAVEDVILVIQKIRASTTTA